MIENAIITRMNITHTPSLGVDVHSAMIVLVICIFRECKGTRWQGGYSHRYTSHNGPQSGPAVAGGRGDRMISILWTGTSQAMIVLNPPTNELLTVFVLIGCRLFSPVPHQRKLREIFFHRIEVVFDLFEEFLLCDYLGKFHLFV